MDWGLEALPTLFGSDELSREQGQLWLQAWEAATNSHAAGQAAGQPSIMQQGLGFSLQGWAGLGDSLQLPTRDQLLLASSDLAPLLILLIFPKLRPPAARLWTGLTTQPFEAVALAPFSS